MKTLLVACAAACLAAPAVLADDLFPPPWRGDPGTTFQHWTFDAPPLDPYMIPPDFNGNPFGEPYIVDSWGGSGYWYDQFEGRQGVEHFWWDFWIDLPNDPTPRDWKDILIQFTYYEDDPVTWDHGTPVIDDVFIPAGWYDAWMLQEFSLGGGWYYSQWYIHIEPNPDFESIHIIASDGFSELTFDQIVIDTICIPTPASLGLLGLGGLLAVRRRR